MAELSVTRTKDYLILKIPLREKKAKVLIPVSVERAITEGLKAYARGRVAGPFNAKEAATFLRKQ